MLKEKSDQKYLQIAQADFLNINSSRSGDSYFRSLESYLVKNNREYNVDGEDCYIYVNDKEDAMSLGFHFNFRKIKYFDGKELLSIDLAKKRVREASKIVITNNFGEKITRKDLKEQPYEEVKNHCLEIKEIIKRCILTKKELEKAINDNKLTEICVLKKRYFDRQELVDFIKNMNK